VNSKAVQNIGQWLLQGLTVPEGPHGESQDTHAWWKVMCLTEVDYFSTLGYQPGIAFLAAGALSPVATLILVLVTLFAAYPVYSRVAEQSPNGQGSISMLERLFPNWTGKMFVLCLLGFAATDFLITITLSAADGTAHLIRNPFVPSWLHHQVGLTLVLLGLLGAIFLKGFKEAIGIAVFLVAIYLALNTIVVSVAVAEVLKQPEAMIGWEQRLWHNHGSIWPMLGLSVIIFPKLALDSSSPRRQIWRTIRRTQSVKHVLRTQARPEICAAKRRGTERLRSNQPVRSWTSGRLRRPEQFRRSSPSRRNVGA
jgi:hypothetical protein